MSIPRPYHRNYRAIKEGSNSGYSDWAYIKDKKYAKAPEHYVRAFLLIQSDLLNLFNFVEPSEESLNTFSFKIHELLLRTCIEIEANFKAILQENIFTPKDQFDYKMKTYHRINSTHHLSSYEVALPVWNGGSKSFKPFSCWSVGSEESPVWYKAYNASKHDRLNEFKQANLGNLLEAISGLLVLLSSQFKTEDFSSGSFGITVEGYDYHPYEPAIGGYFRIKFPDDWEDEEKYDFNWSKLKLDENCFQKFNYDEKK